MSESPHGFTWDDVDRHFEMAGFQAQQLYMGFMPPHWDEDSTRALWADLRDWHLSMADRIAALLPSRSMTHQKQRG